MVRPLKEGLDYFPHDTDAANDEKIDALRSLYGNDGYAFYFIMLERIYRTNNLEIDVSDAETREEMLQILSRKVAVTKQKFSEMLNTAFKWGCFDHDEYVQNGVITSFGIKKRAAAVLEKREKMRAQYQSRISAAEMGEETRQRKEKKRKEKKSNNTPSTPLKTSQQKLFDQFWTAYPKRQAKGQAEKAWMKINPDEHFTATLLTAIERAKQSEDWLKENGKYIPLPATWLNSKRWEDEATIKLVGKEQKLPDAYQIRRVEGWDDVF